MGVKVNDNALKWPQLCQELKVVNHDVSLFGDRLFMGHFMWLFQFVAQPNGRCGILLWALRGSLMGTVGQNNGHWGSIMSIVAQPSGHCGAP